MTSWTSLILVLYSWLGRVNKSAAFFQLLYVWFLSSCEHASLPLRFAPVNLYGLAMNGSLLWALSLRCIQSHSTWHSTKIFLPQDAWLQSQVYAFLLSCLAVLVLQRPSALVLCWGSLPPSVCLLLFGRHHPFILGRQPVFPGSHWLQSDCSCANTSADISGHIFSKVGVQDKFLVNVGISVRFKNVTLSLVCAIHVAMPTISTVSSEANGLVTTHSVQCEFWMHKHVISTWR